ncbi:MAG: hypothetical protein SFU83_24505 [Meiothermus sp.]|nr:hypothetical protein [Meiothermus sp.]
MDWPDKFAFLTTSTDELHERKAGDSRGSHRGVDKLLVLVGCLEP